MPTYYDEKTKKWFCQFRYTDSYGNIKQKRKRGFKKQKEAKEYERDFLSKVQYSLSMKFSDFLDIYQQDMLNRIKPKTKIVKENIINNHILPYFKDKKMNEISSMDIRLWQNEILKHQFSLAYQKKINGILNAIFNYASKYYDLKANPCQSVDSIGKHKSQEKVIYTLEEFKKLIECCDDEIDIVIFTTLYFTGLRKGELFALTLADIDLDNLTINIDKSYQRINAKDITTSPKTSNSYRKVSIPRFLGDLLQKYINQLYNKKPTDPLFTHHYVKIRGRLIKAQNKAKLNNKFTLHSFRHSHVSLLIDLGYSPTVVADRIGDTVDTVLKTYSHLYASSKETVPEKLNEIYK